MKKLKYSIKNMKQHASDEATYLDGCCLQSCMSVNKRKKIYYYMTLLSHAAVHGQKEMVDELLSGASKVITKYMHAYECMLRAIKAQGGLKLRISACSITS